MRLVGSWVLAVAMTGSDARGSVTPPLNALGSMMLLATMTFLSIGGLIYRRLAGRTRVGEKNSLTDFVASQA